MCGINGTIVPEGLGDGLDGLTVIGAMNRRLVHRGPDEGGRRGRKAHREGAHISKQNAAASAWLLAQLARWMERFGVTA